MKHTEAEQNEETPVVRSFRHGPTTRSDWFKLRLRTDPRRYYWLGNGFASTIDRAEVFPLSRLKEIQDRIRIDHNLRSFGEFTDQDVDVQIVYCIPTLDPVPLKNFWDLLVRIESAIDYAIDETRLDPVMIDGNDLTELKQAGELIATIRERIEGIIEA